MADALIEVASCALRTVQNYIAVIKAGCPDTG